MNYTQKLTLSMLVPTTMVAGAGSAVVLGARWLQGVSATESQQVISGYLMLGSQLTALLTALCVATCIGFTVWIRRTAKSVLGGDPSQASAALAALAGGELALALPAAPKGSLLDSLQRLVTVLRASIGDIRHCTQAISLSSNEISMASNELNARTEHTASNLQRTTSGMEQLTGTVAQAANAARQANALAGSAAQVAERGGVVVGQVVETMDGINQSSQRISEIITTIDAIAFQTNILALNAAVEAARAGDQGRGFAVVASEVRALAGRSAQAAKEIKILINDSVGKVQAGSRLVSEAGMTMDDIVRSVQRVGGIIGEITAAASEQAQAIGTVNREIMELDQMTQQNAAMVEESAAVAENLKSQAAHLVQAVALFRVQGQRSQSLRQLR